jgi:hypothetical protein
VHGSWPWLVMAGLGAYHGLNPAMGWLFAVSLGMQDGDRRQVTRALIPIAIGHEASIALVAALVIGLGLLTDTTVLHVGGAVALIAFGVFRFAKPRAHFRWVKGRVNRRELSAWSFLMSTAHGAGLMVAPVLIGASANGTANAASVGDHAIREMNLGTMSIPQTGLAIFLHVGTMLVVMAVVALLVYDRLGVSILRRTWVNSDHLWAATFVGAGAITLIT